jgi:hypothetical protein
LHFSEQAKGVSNEDDNEGTASEEEEQVDSGEADETSGEDIEKDTEEDTASIEDAVNGSEELEEAGNLCPNAFLSK